MYRASDATANEHWCEQITAAVSSMELEDEVSTVASDLFLSIRSGNTPNAGPAVLAAASLYAATLITGNEQPQRRVAEQFDVSRLSVQNNWKPILQRAGFQPPRW